MEPDSEVADRRRRLVEATQLAAVGQPSRALRRLLVMWREVKQSGTATERLLVSRHIAVVCAQLGRPDIALKHMDDALVTGESTGWDNLATGMCRALLGDASGAETAFKTAHAWATEHGAADLAQIAASYLRQDSEE